MSFLSRSLKPTTDGRRRWRQWNTCRLHTTPLHHRSSVNIKVRPHTLMFCGCKFFFFSANGDGWKNKKKTQERKPREKNISVIAKTNANLCIGCDLRECVVGAHLISFGSAVNKTGEPLFEWMWFMMSMFWTTQFLSNANQLSNVDIYIYCP